MNNLIGQSNFLQSLGWAVLNSLWQMALLWIIYQLIVGVANIKRPATRSFLASAFVISGFAWFVYTFSSIYLFESKEGISAAIISAEGNPQLNQWLDKTLPLASLIYLVLLIFPLLHFTRNYRFVQAIRKYGLTRADVEWRIFVGRVAAQMGIKKKVQVWVSELVSSPVTVGFLKPVILVPLAAINHLSAQQLEAILLHELSHIRRHDYFINLVVKFIQSILYFNPFVKAFVAIIEREREKSCDDMVMQFQYDPHGYASALLVLEKNNQLPKTLAVAASGKKNDLLHRIEWIMGVQKKPVVSFNKLAGVFAGLLCIIALNAVLILSKPVVEKNNPTASIAAVASPFYFFAGDETRNNEPAIAEEKKADTELAVTEANTAIVLDEVAKQAAKISEAAALNAEATSAQVIHPFATAVAAFEQPVIPELKKYQEAEIEKALAASKKVLQEGQWKAVEKNIADVFTQQQKEALKAEYMKEMSKIDLENWEKKLKSSYDKVDWERVNIQLNQAVANIRLDSLQYVYSKALSNLSVMESELKQNNLTAIPDSDISLQSLEEKKAEVQKELNKIKLVKSKKIVRL